jgi:hypothetical protein
MAHHSGEIPLAEIRRMQQLLGQNGLVAEARLREQLGATGRFPEGKIAEHDEGEIRFAIAADPSRGKVLIDFGKSIRSLGMTSEQAAELGEMLIKKSMECRGISCD